MNASYSATLLVDWGEDCAAARPPLVSIGVLSLRMRKPQTGIPPGFFGIHAPSTYNSTICPRSESSGRCVRSTLIPYKIPEARLGLPPYYRMRFRTANRSGNRHRKTENSQMLVCGLGVAGA